ncbi:helix-hairpin-helix domain-containing protein [Nocardioides sp. W7]|uniref:helix-hairpin-helix domain-containing protein n=1 Tax=Nocardioides sp. W7 TaxID=2931390 RepID=UPI001FD18A08|nr:helix-hairpin-helix domain-containing protein [Nocardioides sp. W7]
MRTRRTSPEHQEAVARRLAQLSAELATSRPEPDPWPAEGPEPVAAFEEPDEWWADHTRVAWSRPAEPVPESAPGPGPETGPETGPEALAPELPLPGRHAARRRLAPGRIVAGLLPETLRGSVGLGPAHVAVVAVLVALGLAVTCWWVVRGDAEPGPAGLEAAAGGDPVAAPAALEPPATGTPTGGAPASGGAVPAAGTVTVDVAGKVRRPGIAVLDVGARVVDAVQAAGGARRGVDLSSINLARVLIDGEQILVGEPARPAGAAAAPGAGAPAAGALVNLNTATVTELELLPEVGPVTAQAIVTWRDEHGGFTAVQELLEIDGIGDKTLATITPHVTV